MTDDADDGFQPTQQILNDYLSLFAEQRWDEWIELWADDGVLEFPFAPAGRQRRYVGRQAILGYMQPLGGRMKIDELAYFDVHPMADPSLVCFEMGLAGHIVATGAAYNQKYISIVEIRDGKIARYREYWDPIVSMDANGGRDTWTAAFGSPDRDIAS